jgi:hypothetical protein
LAEDDEVIEHEFEAADMRAAHQHVKKIVHDIDFEVIEIIELPVE